MVLLRGIDDLSEYKGHATGAFGNLALTGYQQKLAATGPEAHEAYAGFIAAAETLRSSENAFNSRARKSGPDLKGNLRSNTQFAAIKGFNSAKEALLGVDSVVGQQIVQLVEKSLKGKAGLKRSFQS
ncbi:MAG TPA: hypothetical protein VEF76_13365 [Patescibacteria group bacterium]|nr:hypothetical protein [Patescibacteria group bacterium]